MLALEVKRGVEATLERVYNATHRRFGKLVVTWTGSTAGIRSEGDTTFIMFPGIDETKRVEPSFFNQLIGYALHELGHKWFTQDAPWDVARNKHGAYVGALINGLEDPRIEQCVIKSGYAPNAESLFEFLTNQVLRKGGYVEPDDFKNIPFMLAIEGRRLHGYSIEVPSIVEASPYRAELEWALKAAHVATDTATIAKIAVELFRKLRQKRDRLQKQQPKQDKPGDKSQEGQPGDGSEPGDGKDGKPGDGKGDKPGSQTSQEGAGDAQGEGEGSGKGAKDDGSQQGQGGDADGDQPSDRKGAGGGHGSPRDEPVGRDPEPTHFIQDQCGAIKSAADDKRPRPHVGKPIYVKFDLL